MEEFLIMLFQFLLEVFGDTLGDCWQIFSEKSDHYSFREICLLLLGIGVVLGFLSLFICPHVVVDRRNMRLAILFLGPVFTGCLLQVRSCLVSRRFFAFGHQFWYGFSLALGWSVVRFAYADRLDVGTV